MGICNFLLVFDGLGKAGMPESIGKLKPSVLFT